MNIGSRRSVVGCEPIAWIQAWAPGSVLQRKCACGHHTGGGACAECRDKREDLRRHKGSGSEPATVPSVVAEVLRTPGQPLDKDTRVFMETRFGHDFGRVRVHTDRKAAESARDVNALAYTVGWHIAFADGQYTSATSRGRRLLAHELAHTLQQSEPVPDSSTALAVTDASDSAEREAHVAAEAVMRGQDTNPQARQSATLARNNRCR
jgi:uncharacterized protein DUF4157